MRSSVSTGPADADQLHHLAVVKQAMAAGSAVALPTLEAIRTLSHPRAGYSTKALESAELLVSGFVADDHNDSTSIAPPQGSQAIAGVGVIVVRWVINVINGVLKRGKEKDEKAGDTTEARRALENVRLWKVSSLGHPMLPAVEIACLSVRGDGALSNRSCHQPSKASVRASPPQAPLEVSSCSVTSPARSCYPVTHLACSQKAAV
jgi:hypothetical protein